MIERREHRRYLVCLEIELREASSSFSSRGTTTDASLGGCYITTIFPLAVGSVVDYTLWVSDQPIRGRASIQTCHPGVGMGIQFIDLSDAAKQTLEKHFQACSALPPQVAFSQLRSLESGK
jgi:PilZ domain-containing protein